jgi:hypothetical protein
MTAVLALTLPWIGLGALALGLKIISLMGGLDRPL